MAKVLGLAVCAACVFAQDFTGTWAGRVRLDGAAQDRGVCVSLWQGKGVSGAVTFDGDKEQADISGGRPISSGVEIDAKGADGAVSMRLRGDENKLSGEVSAGEKHGALTLTKLVPKGNPFGPGISTMPLPKNRIEPEYSDEARTAKLQGAVTLQVEIMPSGAVGPDVRVMKGLGMGLDEKAIEAVKKWSFNPPSMDCKPVRKSAQVQVMFRLP